jgi:hypothetical protein
MREKLEMSSEFTAEEDYRVVRKDPATYWQFDCKRDCTQLSMLDSQQLWGSRMRPKSNFTEITTEVLVTVFTNVCQLYMLLNLSQLSLVKTKFTTIRPSSVYDLHTEK